MKEKEWKLHLIIPLSKLGKTWCIYISSIIQILPFSNMRGDDIYNLNQILINETNDFDKKHSKNSQQFYALPEVHLDKNEILVSNIIHNPSTLIFKISKTII